MSNEDIVQDIKIRGAGEAQDTLEKIGRTGENAFNKLRNTGERLAPAFDRTRVEAANMLNAMAKGEQIGKKLGESLRRVGDDAKEAAKAFGRFGAAVGKAGTAAAGGIFLLTMNASKLTSALKEASTQAGVTTKDLQELRYAAQQSGSDVGTLDRAFATINAGGAVEEKLKAIGIATKDAGGNARSAADILRDFADHIAGLSDPAQRAAVAADVLGRRVGPGLVEMLEGGRKGLADYGKELERLGGTFTDAQLKIGKEFGDAVTRVSTAISGLATKVGLAFGPAFTRLIDHITEAIVALSPHIIKAAEVIADVLGAAIDQSYEAFGPWGAAIASAAASIGGIAAAVSVLSSVFSPIGAIFKAAFLPFKLILPTIVAGLKLVGSSIGGVVTALRVVQFAAAAAFGPWGLAIAAIGAALGYLAVVLIRSFDWDKIKQSASDAWDTIKKTVSDAIDGIVNFFKGLAEGAGNIWDGVVEAASSAVDWIKETWSGFVEWLGNIWGAIKDSASSAWDAVAEAAQNTVTGIVDFFKSLGQGFAGLWRQIVESARTAANAIREEWGNFTSWLGNIWGSVKAATVEAWETISSAVIGAINAILEFGQMLGQGFSDLWDRIVGSAILAGQVLQQTWSNFVTWLGTVWEGAKQASSSAWSAISSAASATVAGLVQVFQMIGQGFSAVWNQIVMAANTAVQTIQETWNSFVEWLGTIWESIKNTTTEAWNVVAQIVTETINTITQLLQQLGQGFTDLWNWMRESAAAAADAVREAWNAFTSWLSQVWEEIKSGAQQAWDAASQAVQSAVQAMMAPLQSLINVLQKVWEMARRAGQALGFSSGGAVPGFSGGGHVYGPGTSTSDSIPARLSRGEYVQRAKATRYYGVRFMDALNRMAISRDAVRSLMHGVHARGFNMGGLVSGLSDAIQSPLRFAAGGLVPAAAMDAPARAAFDIILDGRRYSGFTGPMSVADQLLAEATERRLARGGREPGWRGKR